MNFLRILVSILGWALVLAVILAIAAFVPAFQTWAVGLALNGHPGVHGTLDQLAAGFGKVEVDNLRLERDGTTLIVPSFSARLPVTTAVLRRKFVLSGLVAKGWTLTLQPRAAALDANPDDTAAAADANAAPEAPDQTVARAFAAVLGGWKLPYDVSLDGADLEGDVILAGPKGKKPGKIHVILNGGGLAPGRQGVFALDATGALADPSFPIYAVTSHGQLFVTLDSSRTISRLEMKADLTARGSVLPQELQLNGDLAAVRDNGNGRVLYTVDLSSRGRRFVSLAAHLAEATGLITGTWKVDLRESDLQLWLRDREVPTVAASGNGDFEADPIRMRLHATGQLKAAASHLSVIAPELERIGPVTLDAGFDLTRQGGILRVDRLTVAVAGAQPLGTIKLLQPFEHDEKADEWKATRPKADWAQASMQHVPLAWLTGLMGEIALKGTDLAGGWIVRPAPNGFALRSVEPLVTRDVAVLWNTTPLAHGVDLALTLQASHSAAGWQMQCQPLTITRQGAVLGHLDGKLSPPAPGESMGTFAGKWDADLVALSPQISPAIKRWVAGRSASGDFTASVSVGSGIIFDGKIAVVGTAPKHSLDATVHLEGGGDGSWIFNVPLNVTLGEDKSDLSADGNWSGPLNGNRLQLKLDALSVHWEHLQSALAFLSGTGITPVERVVPNALNAAPSAVSSSNSRDSAAPAQPLWGANTGKVSFLFDRLVAGPREFKHVTGNVEFDHGGLQLHDGAVKYGTYDVSGVGGTLNFDPAAAAPYRLATSANLGKIDSAKFLPPPARGEDPLIEGHFTVAATVTSSGRDLEDLRRNAREEFHLESSSGIVRFLKTDVADAIPQHSSTVGDTLGGAANKLGSFMGMQGRLGSGKNPVTANAQAAIDFTNEIGEIGYDRLAVTAIKEADGTLRLTAIDLTAPDESIQGTGLIPAVSGKPLAERPLSLDWKLGFKGRAGELLGKTKLIVFTKNQTGYTFLSPTLHVGGTVGHPDQSQWHDLLAAAAIRPDPVKK